MKLHRAVQVAAMLVLLSVTASCVTVDTSRGSFSPFGGSGASSSDDSPLPLNAEQLQQLTTGKSLARTDEMFVFGSGGRLLYVDREKGTDSRGLWFLKKAKVQMAGGRIDDMLCVAIGRAEKASFRVMPCIRLYPDQEGRKNTYLGISADCVNTNDVMTDCNFEDRTFGYFVSLDTAGRPQSQRPNLINNNDGTITDRATGLQWAQCSLGQDSFLAHQCVTQPQPVKGGMAEALNMVRDFNAKEGLAGKRDWRLPTPAELKTLVVCSNGKPVPMADGESCKYPLPAGLSERFSRPTFDPVFYGEDAPYLTSLIDKPDLGRFAGAFGRLGKMAWTVDFSTGMANPTVPVDGFSSLHDRDGKLADPVFIRLVRSAGGGKAK